MFRALLLLLFSLVPTVVTVVAQASEDSVFALPELTVISTRIPVAAGVVGARVTQILGEDIRRAGLETVGAVMDRRAGLFVRRYGPGGLAGVSIRGAGPAHTAILLDGQRLYSPAIGQVDLTLLPTIFLSDIEILHGGGSALYGSDAVAGAVNLATLRTGDTETARIASTIGAWGQRSLAARSSVSRGRYSLVAAAELSRSRGDFSYVDRSSFPRTTRSRLNADSESLHIMSSLRYRHRGARTEVSAWLLDGERGLPGHSGAVSAGERQWDRMARLWLRHERFSEATTVRFRAAAQRSSLRYDNPVLGLSETGVSSSLSAEATIDRAVADRAIVQAGVESAFHRTQHPSLIRTRSQANFGLFGSGAVNIGWWGLYPSVRADMVVRDVEVEWNVSPALRVRRQLGRSGDWAVKGGAARSFRVPTLNDLYWRGAGTAGNPELTAERGLSADLGVQHLRPAATSEITFFAQNISNQIAWITDDSGTWSPVNVGRVRSLGVEVMHDQRARIGRRIRARIRTAYTYVRARDRSDPEAPSFGKPLRYVPAHTMSSDGEISKGIVSAAAVVRLASRRFVTTDGATWLSPYSVLDARVTVSVDMSRAVLDMGLYVDNVTGAQYEVLSGYPMPPRHMRLKLSVTVK